jgi:alanyl-tRNA synthetase
LCKIFSASTAFAIKSFRRDFYKSYSIVFFGVTNELTKKYDAVTLVKIASEALDGKSGGGRKDFAQAGGTNKNKIEKAFENLSKKIN